MTWWIVLPGLSLAAGCRAEDQTSARADRALAAAIRALVAAQSPDGAWRSQTYGALKDGLSLTPPILKALTFSPTEGGADAARRRAATFLIGRTRTDGTIVDDPLDLVYPVYTAAASVIALGRLDVSGAADARDAWLRELRRRQLTEPLGWRSSDPAFGSWGYAIEPPTRPERGLPKDQPLDADLSSTLFAVGALRIAGSDANDPAVRKAITFVERCQNFADNASAIEAAFDDGGFFFTPTDLARNKAGIAGTDRGGRVRFRSYGSATADGIRALLRCGLPADHPRVASARGWLQRNFSARVHPGAFAPGREVERDATYFYYAWSTAHAFGALGVRAWEAGGRKVDWAEDLARELVERQNADGTWTNPVGASKEDDPLVATPLAAGALALARAAIAP